MSFEQNRDLKGPLSTLLEPTSRPRRAILCLGILLPTLLAWGCSGIVSGQNTTPSQPPPQTFSISGTITPVTGGNGATITITGAANATATANSSGNFTVSGLANGTYTITPSHAGYSFSPSSMNVTINNASVTTGIGFTATALTFGISGTLSPVVGGGGATVMLSGARAASTIADTSGRYSFSGLANGAYAVSPSHTGYTFTPNTQAATINGGNVSGIDFTATPQSGSTFSISGTVSPTAGGSGATVTLGGASSGSVIADSAGNYSFTALTNGVYTVTPSNTGYTFTPVSQSVPVNGVNVTSVNFTATPQVTHSVALSWSASTSTTVSGYYVYRSTVSGSGYARVNSLPISALAYTDSTVLNATTYYYVTTAVDASGVESTYSNEVPAAVP
jgi:hypothetical protein